jgi:hypothetical protein
MTAAVHGGQPTDAVGRLLYAPRMSQSLPDSVTTRVRNIKDVADDLTRELIRAQVPAVSAVFDMVAFIHTEAETILVDLTEPDGTIR